jgi:FtsH-binding integral membrane protein
MPKVRVRRIWGWMTVGIVVLWVIHRLRFGWPSPLSEQWLFYIVSAALLALFSLILARVQEQVPHARGQGEN